MSSKEIREDLIEQKRVMEPEKGKAGTYVNCRLWADPDLY
jgi:hypothetical protein